MKSIAFVVAAAAMGLSVRAAPVVTFTERPVPLQLVPRDASDSGTVVISGTVAGAGYDSIVVEVKKAGAPYARPAAVLAYTGDTALFSISVRLSSELAEYGFTIYGNTTRLNGAENVVCGDVVVIDGQSNAEAAGSSAFNQGEWVRSAGYAQYTAGGERHATWGYANYDCCRSPGAGIVGTNLGKFLALSNRTPMCVINGAVSGTRIELHQRNNANPMDTTTIYGRILLRATVSGLLSHVRSILYYQGEYHSSATTYAGLFDRMYKSWKGDYPALEKVFVMQVNAGCNEGGAYNAQVREIQRKFGETYHDVTVMTAVGLKEFTGCHYGNNGYIQTAQWWFPVYNRELYGNATPNVGAPKLLSASFASQAHTALDLTFDMPVVWPGDPDMKNGVALGGVTGLVSSASSIGNVLRLNLSSSSSATTVSYVPADSYMGPYLYSEKGVGVVTFLNYPITAGSAIESAVVNAERAPVLRVSPNPFNAAVRINYKLQIANYELKEINLAVYDMAGRKVTDLTDKIHNSSFVICNSSSWISGVYMARLSAGGKTYSKRLILLK